jgi:DNA-binding response OmpR family regulator
MGNAFADAGVELDRAGRRLVRGGRWLPATNGEIETLVLLLDNAGSVVPRAQLPTSSALHIAHLRDKLDVLGAVGEELLVSIPGAGYWVPGTLGDAQRARLLHMSWLSFDPETRRVWWLTRSGQLTEKCGKLLAVLLAGAGRTVAYEALTGLRDQTVLSRLRSDLARVTGGRGNEIVVDVRGYGYRLQSPLDARFVRCRDPEAERADDGRVRVDPQFLRCWGVELDRVRGRLRVAGREHEIGPAWNVVAEALIESGGLPVSDKELLARARRRDEAVGDLDSVLRSSPLASMVERAPRDARRLALERLSPGLLQVGALILNPRTGEAWNRRRREDLTPALTPALAALMRAHPRVLSPSELLGAVQTDESVGATARPTIRSGSAVRALRCSQHGLRSYTIPRLGRVVEALRFDGRIASGRDGYGLVLNSDAVGDGS